MLADGQAGTEERTFIDALQQLLEIPDADTLQVVEVLLVKNSR